MRTTEPYTIFPRKMKSGKTVYYYQFRDEYGRRSVAHSTGCESLSQAKRFCQKLYNEQGFRQDSSTKFLTFSTGFFDTDSEYCRWRQVSKGAAIKPETLRRYNDSLSYQILPYFADMKLKDITQATVKSWIVWCSERWSAKTINNAKGVLNLIFDSAVEKRLIQSNPCFKIPVKKIEKKDRELLSVAEVRSLYHLEWSSEKERQMFLLACITGMRIGEVSALQPTDVQDGYLDVKHTYSERYGLGKTKTGKCRCIPVPQLEFDMTGAYCFTNDGETPILPHCIYNAFTRKCDKLGIDRMARGITLHSMRNFFISYMRGHNVPLEKIKAVVGHADESMTDWYTYWSKEMFAEVYEQQRILFEEITSD